MSSKAQATLSEWSPLRISLFRALWFATLAANIGTWMQNVGGVWLMTSLSPSPLLVALMQAAASFPVILVGLPAGALADIVSRRQLLLITNIWTLIAAAGLSLLTFLHLTNIWILLIFTFALGLGATVSNPAWQAINSELVPPDELPAAVTLSSVSFNLARAVGPALGGVIVGFAGPSVVFLLNALAFLYVVFVIYRWHPALRKSMLPTERMFGAIRTGVRYTFFAPELHTVLIRTGAFIFCASGLWALLPSVVRHELKLGSLGYGLLLGFIGLGAVVGAAFLPRIQQKLPVDMLITMMTFVYAGAMIGLGFLHNLFLLCTLMFLCGIAWLALVSSFNVAAQEASPAWVRARFLGIYLLIFQGGTAIGSIVWGLVASQFSDSIALLVGAIGAIIGVTTALRWHIADSERLDLTLWHTSQPKVIIEPTYEEGPILVEMEYHVQQAMYQDFIHAMFDMRRIRERDGAVHWNLYSDPDAPNRHIETFMMESWLEFLRQQDRLTNTDRAINDHVLSLLEEKGVQPAIKTFIAEHPTKNSARS
ncbi:MAG: MFS transporter [Ktedonobacteraceae bacterium]